MTDALEEAKKIFLEELGKAIALVAQEIVKALKVVRPMRVHIDWTCTIC